LIDANSTLAVHAVCIADLNGDGKNELLSASDDAGGLDLYTWDEGRQKQQIAKPLPHDWVWTIEWGDADSR